METGLGFSKSAGSINHPVSYETGFFAVRQTELQYFRRIAIIRWSRLTSKVFVYLIVCTENRVCTLTFFLL